LNINPSLRRVDFTFHVCYCVRGGFGMNNQEGRCKQFISLVGHSKPARCDGHIEETVSRLQVAGREVFQVKTTCVDCGTCQQRLCVPLDEEIFEVNGPFSPDEATLVLVQIKNQMYSNGGRDEVSHIDDILSALRQRKISPQDAINRASAVRDKSDPCR